MDIPFRSDPANQIKWNPNPKDPKTENDDDRSKKHTWRAIDVTICWGTDALSLYLFSFLMMIWWNLFVFRGGVTRETLEILAVRSNNQSQLDTCQGGRGVVSCHPRRFCQAVLHLNTALDSWIVQTVGGGWYWWSSRWVSFKLKGDRICHVINNHINLICFKNSSQLIPYLQYHLYRKIFWYHRDR